MKFTIDTKTDSNYFIVLDENKKQAFKVSKRCNTLDKLKKYLGNNLKAII